MQSASQDSRFRRIYVDHRNAVAAYCLRRTSRADAMDAVAETFAVAWRRIDDLPTGEAELSWLYAVAHRVVANQLRSNRRLRKLRTKMGGTGPSPDAEPIEVLVQAEEERRLLQALSGLRSADQEILRLVTWEEHPRDRVAQMLGITRPALDQRLHRAMKRLRGAYRAGGHLSEARPTAVRRGTQ